MENRMMEEMEVESTGEMEDAGGPDDWRKWRKWDQSEKMEGWHSGNGGRWWRTGRERKWRSAGLMEVAGDPKEGGGENGDGDGDHRRIGWSQRVEVAPWRSGLLSPGRMGWWRSGRRLSHAAAG